MLFFKEPRYQVAFEQYYKEKSPNWKTYCTNEQADNILRVQYKNFYTEEGEINYHSLQSGVVKADPKARDLSKELFRIDWIVKNNPQTSLCFKELVYTYGPRLTAHGVEEEKGGLQNIVMMCISGDIKAQSTYWGSMVEGPPNISPLPHGPYFIIYDTKIDSNKPAPHNPRCRDIMYVLVPCEEIASFLKVQLDRAKTLGLIQESELQSFKSKIITYQALLDKLTKEDTLRFVPRPALLQSQ